MIPILLFAFRAEAYIIFKSSISQGLVGLFGGELHAMEVAKMILRSFFDKLRYYDLQPFPLISKCRCQGRSSQTIVSDFLGTLLKGRSCFPYFMLVAFEAGGFLRAFILLLLAPITWLLHHFVSREASIKLMIFVSITGLKVSEIELISLGVLSKFYAEQLRSRSYRVFSSFGSRCVITELPQIMVEPFAKRYLRADLVVGTKICSTKGGKRATGFVHGDGVLIGEKKLNALKRSMSSMPTPNVGMGDCESDYPFMEFCEESYLVPLDPTEPALPLDKLASPVIFHDGRLIKLPTPLTMLLIFLWIPIAFPLSVLRIAAGSLLPMRFVYHAFLLLGVKIVIKGNPPPRNGGTTSNPKTGVLFVCSHRSLLDPIFLSAALGRPVTAVTYSISRLSELLSPIKTARLSRDRTRDAQNIRQLLQTGDLVICPEGTTCRTPYLLRFSSLFAELTDQIVPVGMDVHVSTFHGSSARTWKGADPFYFFMNPFPCYVVTVLDQLPLEKTCSETNSSHAVANYIQGLLAGALGFKCTSFTRRDKYQALTGTDGIVSSSSPVVTAC